jgi:hypothetical protein
MERIRAGFQEIATMSGLVAHHAFDDGDDDGRYFNFTFGARDAKQLWRVIQDRFYNSGEFGLHMRRSSMAMCSSESGWDTYLLLFHFDPGVKLDADTAL